jgi:hypothetical protein
MTVQIRRNSPLYETSVVRSTSFLPSFRVKAKRQIIMADYHADRLRVEEAFQFWEPHACQKTQG